MDRKIRQSLRRNFKFSLKGAINTLIILTLSVVICFLLRSFNNGLEFVSMIFILSVFLVSVSTEGYLFGILSSVFCVLATNYIFTYPYFEFNFTLPGYPITIICMLVVSIITSTLTTQIKQHESIRFEAEREKTRSNLLRAVSHDLRTPLTSILGASSAIIENDDILEKSDKQKLLSEIKEDASWLIRMVENLLSITRIDAENGAKITKQSEACEEVIAVSVAKFKNRFPESNVEINIPDELLIIPMDAILIEQVILNLFENVAIHSKGATKAELFLYTDDNNAVFEVSDNGCGIDENILPHIFEGYFKHNYEDKGDKKKNMGIGLSVCNTIIKAHNGTMTAQNKKSGGAVFSFKLPFGEVTNEQ